MRQTKEIRKGSLDRDSESLEHNFPGSLGAAMLDRLLSARRPTPGRLDFFLLILVFLLMMVAGTFCIQAAIHFLFPTDPLWDFNDGTTLIMSSILASSIAFFALRHIGALFRAVQAETEMRMKTEKKLKMERDRLMSILESMEDGVYIVSPRHDIEYVNPVIEREFGAVTGRKCFEYFHDRSEPCPWCLNREVLAGKSVRWTWTSPKNNKIYDLFDTPFRKSDGSVSKLEIFRDVTEFMRAQESVRDNEEKYRLLFNEVHDAIFLSILSPEGEFDRFIEANSVAGRLLGYSPEELVGLSPYDITAPEEHDEVRENFRKFITDHNRLFERTLIRKDGERIPVEFSGHMFFYNSLPTLICVARDISERRLAERSLRESEQNYKRLSLDFDALLNAMTDSLLLLSSDLKVLWANNAAGVACLHDLSFSDDRHCYGAVRDRVLCGQCPAPKTLRTKRPETKMAIMQGRHIEMRAFPILDSGVVRRVLLAMTDVTEKVSLQAKAMQARHLASIGELAAGVAHEINNPVNGIMNCAQILINRSKDIESGGELGQRILKESERIATIVRSLLSFARQNQNERTFSDVRTLVAESLVLAKVKLKKDNIRVTSGIPEALPPVIVNSQQIQQVVLNIINNAHYALNQKYPGYAQAKTIEITGEEIRKGGERLVRLSFLDGGIGIPAGNLNVVTEPFFSTKPSGEGTGLGLSICREIIEDHKGFLLIESVEGEYTRVSIELPVGEKSIGKNSDRR